MNMADAVLDAWTFWNNNGGAAGGDAIFDELAEINWEAGDDLEGSYYNGYIWDHINIADGPADPDQWDDSVIIHEWNHQADDTYGCDDTPGGDHSSRQNLGDQELAWSEGYANYYQSAVCNGFLRTDANWYLDGNAMGVMGGTISRHWCVQTVTHLQPLFLRHLTMALLPPCCGIWKICSNSRFSSEMYEISANILPKNPVFTRVE